MHVYKFSSNCTYMHHTNLWAVFVPQTTGRILCLLLYCQAYSIEMYILQVAISTENIFSNAALDFYPL